MRQDLDFNHGNICSIKHVWLGSERSRTLRRQILAELELAPEHAAGHTATRTSGRVGPRRGAKLAYSDQTPRWKWHLCCCVLGRIESRAPTRIKPECLWPATILAPASGLEPPTCRLTAGRSAD